MHLYVAIQTLIAPLAGRVATAPTFRPRQKDLFSCSVRMQWIVAVKGATLTTAWGIVATLARNPE